jgi:hypothetical protein
VYLLLKLKSKYYILRLSVCSLRYPARNAHAPYCHLWPAPLYNIFPHYLINGTIFEKKSLDTKCVFWFSVQRLSETFLILRRTERDMIKNVYRSECEVPLLLLDCNDTWIFCTRFQKSLKCKISWKSVQLEPSCSMQTDRRTDGLGEACSRFPQFFENTWKSNIWKTPVINRNLIFGKLL